MESNSTAILIKIKLRHSLGRPSRSDFVQFVFIMPQIKKFSRFVAYIKKIIDNIVYMNFYQYLYETKSINYIGS